MAAVCALARDTPCRSPHRSPSNSRGRRAACPNPRPFGGPDRIRATTTGDTTDRRTDARFGAYATVKRLVNPNKMDRNCVSRFVIAPASAKRKSVDVRNPSISSIRGELPSVNETGSQSWARNELYRPVPHGQVGSEAPYKSIPARGGASSRFARAPGQDHCPNAHGSAIPSTPGGAFGW